MIPFIIINVVLLLIAIFISKIAKNNIIQFIFGLIAVNLALAIAVELVGTYFINIKQSTL